MVTVDEFVSVEKKNMLWWEGGWRMIENKSRKEGEV